MKKLTLSIDELQVATFQTLPDRTPELGTVRARQAEDGYAFAATDASNCASCETCQGPNCCGCRDSTVA
ncbi:MAG TPA: hypothetical protein VFR37_23535 [Longimicrobium sp.]|nr:hypothetical protein [Longimicrobium sp.]